MVVPTFLPFRNQKIRRKIIFVSVGTPTFRKNFPISHVIKRF
ncbi:hypothetical protein LEP1GSC125_1988 [Leptospira mayottensis 200901122]|uniref:Uncharacterized protein n=1 Tax=Leptospira mayottensis 200901122 TaxID=1193010 RepID=A0AA87SY96_9LEPT|nr:hypothetical protein LEP1GSC125_1988 [Leptospira mayottensis 200901122]